MRKEARPQRDVIGLRKQLGREPIPDRESKPKKLLMSGSSRNRRT